MNKKNHIFQINNLQKIVFNTFFLVFCSLFLFSSFAYAEKRVLKIAVYDSSYLPNAELGKSCVGLSYLKELEKYGDFTFEYIKVENDNLTQILETEKIDLVSFYRKSVKREERFLFSAFPAGFDQSTLSVLVNNDKYYFNDYSTFNGLRIGLRNYSFEQEELRNFVKERKFSYIEKIYDSNSVLEQALSANEVDAILLSNYVITPQEKVIATLPPQPFYLATTKNNADIMQLIDQAQEQLHLSEPTLVKKFYAEGFFHNDLQLDESEKSFIAQDTLIKVAYLENNPPFSTYDPVSRQASGINIKIWELIAKQANLKYSLVSVPNQEQMQQMLENNEIDVSLGYPREIDTLNVKLSEPYLEVPLVIVGKSNTFEEDDVFALPFTSENILNYFKLNFPKNEIVMCGERVSCFEAVARNKASYTLINMYKSSYLLQDDTYSNMHIISVTNQLQSLYFALSNNADARLLSIINNAIDQISGKAIDSVLLPLTINRPAQSKIEIFINRYKLEVLTSAALISLLLFLFLINLTLTLNSNKKALWKLAYIDELTGLPNFVKFKLDARECLEKNDGLQYISIIVDINKFNLINETLGFSEADKVIIAVGNVLSENINPKTDLLSRIQADYFILLMAVSKDMKFSPLDNSSYDRFRDAVERAVGHKLHFAIGRYMLSENDKDISEIYEKVNYAHSLAKQNNAISPVYDYAEELKKIDLRNKEIEEKMDNALFRDEFSIFLQPKFSLADESIVGAEALVRWEVRETGETIYPSEFIPLFEKNGFITKLDFYMFEKACELLQGWKDHGLPLTTISVNFSRLHLANSNFISDLIAVADKFDIEKHFLEIELTETTMNNNEELLEFLLHGLHQAGFTLSMDDFGTGYSSLGLLKNLPVDVIKIDRSFFTNNKFKSRAKTVLQNIINMAKDLNIHTVAEGVESQEHIDILREIGCENVQGYYYAKPMPAELFTLQAATMRAENSEVASTTYNTCVGLTQMERENVSVDIMPQLFLFSIQEALSHSYGEGDMQDALRLAGKIAGTTFNNEFLDINVSFNDFIVQLKEKLNQYKIASLYIEAYDEESQKILLVMSYDFDSPLAAKVNDHENTFEEGFLAAIFSAFIKKQCIAQRVDAWASTPKVCRYQISKT